MSCLDVMYQVYGPPQAYFAAAYSPYPQVRAGCRVGGVSAGGWPSGASPKGKREKEKGRGRGGGEAPAACDGERSRAASHLGAGLGAKLAFYSKMQEAPESGSSASTSSSFSGHAAASIKEEDCSPEKERPPEAEYISSRCVLFTYFQGDISAVVDEHFSRALSQPSSFSLGSAKARNAGSWRDGSFPMSQRSFPPSFWNSTYQPSTVPATLSSPLAASRPQRVALRRCHRPLRAGLPARPPAPGWPRGLAPCPPPPPSPPPPPLPRDTEHRLPSPCCRARGLRPPLRPPLRLTAGAHRLCPPPPPHTRRCAHASQPPLRPGKGRGRCHCHLDNTSTLPQRGGGHGTKPRPQRGPRFAASGQKQGSVLVLELSFTLPPLALPSRSLPVRHGGIRS
uniref:Vestigial like family member 2 n=1 Tax=Anas platyrhynchos TaxID=8839 RepID=A0A8B9ZH82_ANAPL